MKAQTENNCVQQTIIEGKIKGKRGEGKMRMGNVDNLKDSRGCTELTQNAKKSETL